MNIFPGKKKRTKKIVRTGATVLQTYLSRWLGSVNLGTEGSRAPNRCNLYVSRGEKPRDLSRGSGDW